MRLIYIPKVGRIRISTFVSLWGCTSSLKQYVPVSLGLGPCKLAAASLLFLDAVVVYYLHTARIEYLRRMIIARREHKKDSVHIIADTFDANPSVNIVIGDSGNRQKKIRRLADYAFVKSLNRKGAYLSDNKMGTALCFDSSEKVFSVKEIFYEVRFALSIPVRKVIQTVKRESYIKKHRIDERHLYFWFLGVQKGGGKAGFEMKDYLFALAEEEQIPIILETSVERNKSIYERYGFEVYHVWEDSGGGKPLWFMMRNSKSE